MESDIVTNNDVEAAKKDIPNANLLANSKCKNDSPNESIIRKVIIKATTDICFLYLLLTTPRRPFT